MPSLAASGSAGGIGCSRQGLASFHQVITGRDVQVFGPHEQRHVLDRPVDVQVAAVPALGREVGDPVQSHPDRLGAAARTSTSPRTGSYSGPRSIS